jgi:hypothetical protein
MATTDAGNGISAPPRLDRGRLSWRLAVPVLLAILAFANAIPNGFVYDDRGLIARFSNDSFPGGSYWNLRRSVTLLSYWTDWRLWGTWSPGYRVSSIALHALATALVGIVARAITGRRSVAFVAAILFAVHPVHVEAVASFANRKDVLALIFALLTLRLWLVPGRRAYVAALACFVLGLLSKEVAVIGLVVMLILADLLLRRAAAGGERRAPGARGAAPARGRLMPVARAAPIVAIGVAVSLWSTGPLREAFSTEHLRAVTESQTTSRAASLANSAAGMGDVFRLLFFPARLSADYDIRPGVSFTAEPAILGLALAGAWALGAVLLARRAPVIAFGMAWTLVMYFPYSNALPLTHVVLAERYLYVASFGVCLGIAAAGVGCFDRFRRRIPRWGLLAILVLAAGAGAARSISRNHEWRDELALWSSADRSGFDTFRVHHNLGTILTEQERYDEAVAHFRRALRLPPSNATPYARIGLVRALFLQDRVDEAAAECEPIIEAYPRDAACRFVLGVKAWRSGRWREAIEHLEIAVASDADDPATLARLAWLLALSPERRLRDPSRAVRLATKAVERSEAPVPAEVLLTLGVAYGESGDRARAIDWCTRAREAATAAGNPSRASAIDPIIAVYRSGSRLADEGGGGP